MEMLFQEKGGWRLGLCLAIVQPSGECIGSSIQFSGSGNDLKIKEGEELSPLVLSSVEWIWFPEIGKVLVVSMYLEFLSVEVVLPLLKGPDNHQHFQVIDIIVELGISEFHGNTVNHLPCTIFPEFFEGVQCGKYVIHVAEDMSGGDECS